LTTYKFPFDCEVINFGAHTFSTECANLHVLFARPQVIQKKGQRAAKAKGEVGGWVKNWHRYSLQLIKSAINK